GELRSGAAVVGEAAGIEARIREADVVVVGEGRLDRQTAFGKAPQYVARLAREAGRPVICLGGSLGEGYEAASAVFDEIETLSDGRAPLPSPAEAAGQLADAAGRALLRLLERKRVV
ncbi:MAG TPA: glycerate kinase, partial [Dehalococcoidia bacterium]|nr:glycerate kinase [Dehalococcoidia bacterium]